MLNRITSKISALPTAGGGITRAAYAQLIRAKLDAPALLARAGLTVAQAENDNLRIPVRDQIKFLNLASEALADEFLGIRLARGFELRQLGLLYYVQASSPTLGDALQRLARYSGIKNEAVTIHYAKSKHLSVKFEYAGVSRIADRHQTEFFITALVRACRHLTGLHLVPLEVRLVHQRQRKPAAVFDYFGCPVEFGARVDEVRFAADDATIPLANADPFLNSMLVSYCEQALADNRKGAGAWRTRVENTLAALLPHGQAGMAEVARRLGLSQRTLARRLSSEDTTFFDVLDQLRRELAMRYLHEAELSISEISWLLGYEDPSAFNHAFKRWTGKTPSQTRREG